VNFVQLIRRRLDQNRSHKRIRVIAAKLEKVVYRESVDVPGHTHIGTRLHPQSEFPCGWMRTALKQPALLVSSRTGVDAKIRQIVGRRLIDPLSLKRIHKPLPLRGNGRRGQDQAESSTDHHRSKYSTTLRGKRPTTPASIPDTA
jgi:hypothetical protein